LSSDHEAVPAVRLRMRSGSDTAMIPKSAE
jgi:hypothetical protein